MKSVLTILALIFSSTAMATDPFDSVAIMQVGEFHGGEVPTRIGKNWFGLIEVNGKFELRRVEPKITTVFDAVLDDESNKASYSGKKVAVVGVSPLLLIRSKFFKQGPVSQAKLSKDESIVLGATTYKIERACKKKMNPDAHRECKVYLSQGKIKQFIGDATEDGNIDYALTVTVAWAGDLDHDGKLDLILEFGSYNIGSTILYLSSQARKGEISGKVAEFGTSGC